MWVENKNGIVILHSVRPEGEEGENCVFVENIPEGPGYFVFEDGTLRLIPPIEDTEPGIYARINEIVNSI